MYNDIAAPAMAGSGAGMLATTGTMVFWYFLAAFALIAVGAALMRIVPRVDLAKPKGTDTSVADIFEER